MWHCFNRNTGRAWEEKKTDNEATVELAGQQEKRNTYILYCVYKTNKQKNDTSAPLTKRSQDSYRSGCCSHNMHSGSWIQTTHIENGKAKERWQGAWKQNKGNSENLWSDASEVRREIPIRPSKPSNDRDLHWRVFSVTEHSNAIKLHAEQPLLLGRKNILWCCNAQVLFVDMEKI